MSLTAGSAFPSGVKFTYIPVSADESPLACSIPIPFDFDKKAAGKTVVIVAVPGAFTPTCTENHIPPYIEHIKELTAKADYVIVLSANDPFVLHAWGQLLGGAALEKLIFASDANAAFSKSIGYSVDLTDKGFGVRTARYAIVVKDLKVVYSEVESGPGVSVSGYEAVAAKL